MRADAETCGPVSPPPTARWVRFATTVRALPPGRWARRYAWGRFGRAPRARPSCGRSAARAAGCRSASLRRTGGPRWARLASASPGSGSTTGPPGPSCARASERPGAPGRAAGSRGRRATSSRRSRGSGSRWSPSRPTRCSRGPARPTRH